MRCCALRSANDSCGGERGFANHLDLRRNVTDDLTGGGVDFLIVLGDVDLVPVAEFVVPWRHEQLVLAGSSGELDDTGCRHLHLRLDGLLRAVEVALEKRGQLEAPSAFERRNTQENVQSGHRRQMEIKIETIAAPDEDGRGVFDFGCSRVVRGQVNDVKRASDGGGSIRRPFDESRAGVSHTTAWLPRRRSRFRH